MNSLPDSAGDARRAWLCGVQEALNPLQSDFEKSLAWRLTLVVAVVVITINVLAAPPVSPPKIHTPIRSTV
ncbi:hypothetical protein [Paraburkholderia bryophila]|uniref:Uncharacterized protein n=1 Tax=Paraburkholderia bryophila TaxID=420952 RepID=A0A7Y9W3F1_9BURK|nr:hypothetical protein [Paraburkholderia bryophila]NYH13449.1 hypothetical protein [Paraburkholderia bryophila]